ncbi:MAG: symmetrical bis(5'-nucleosyl)-tetraphosphatase [Nitrospirales bacterium]|nr:symmetrical bis(5'-nucleosyl)-tetraphosphatase [Nitrospirales bacterium]
MATYAIGDVQGCFSALRKLLEQVQFDPSVDRLWFVGDLVNRGPESLAVLRYIKGLGEAATTVLGNHDLHLLAVAAGIADQHRNDTIQEILDAPDSEDLLHWVRQQPLLYRESDYVLVHAGLLPQWTVEQAATLAQEVEQALRSDDYVMSLKSLYRSREVVWNPEMPVANRLGFVTNVLTRIRVCSKEEHLNLSYKGPPAQAPDGYEPWYQIVPIAPRKETIIFGHWSALGVLIQDSHLALDGGCVWGATLFALRLEDRQGFHVSCGDGVADT